MRLLSFWRRGVLLLAFVSLALLFTADLSAQTRRPMQRAGRDFTFGVIEGAEQLPGAGGSFQQITLTINAANDTVQDGCGTIYSPGGFAQDFSFSGKTPTVIAVPYSVAHIHDDGGKTNKGILIHTNEPVSVVLHDYIEAAGDATQLYPDESLDTNYFCTGWGLENDLDYIDTGLVNEKNRSEILVTAMQDSTVVTIVPAVKTMIGEPAGQPIVVTLNQGECYIVKADASGHPTTTSLSRSTVTSTKPVSVIVGMSCAYVPGLPVESCNELMDEIVGKSYWSDHYYVGPLGSGDTNDVVAVLISDKDFFYYTINGAPGSCNGRMTVYNKGPVDIQTYNGVKVDVHQLSLGNEKSWLGIGDPTLVQVLDTADWTDTAIWSTPQFLPLTTPKFEDWASIIFPTKSASSIKIDGRPITSEPGLLQQIGTSEMSSFVTNVSIGRHSITSTVPFFPIAAGFAQADAYSFIPGNTSPYIRRDTSHHTITVSVDSAMACHEFGATYRVDPPFSPREHVMSVTITIALNPVYTPVVKFDKILSDEGLAWSIDSLTPGYLTVNIIGHPMILGSDLFRVIFRAARKTGAALLTHGATVCADSVEILTTNPAQFRIAPSADTLRHALAFDNAPAVICSPYVLHLLADSIITSGEAFMPDSIDLTFDPSLFDFTSVSLGAMFGGVPSTITGGADGHYIVKFTDKSTVSGGDTILTLALLPRAGAQATPIHAQVFYHVCDDIRVKDVTIMLALVPNVDTTTANLSVSTSSVSFGTHLFAPVQLTGLPISANVKQFMLFVTYDHGLLTLLDPNLKGTLTDNYWSTTVHPGTSTDTIFFTSSSAPLGISGTLANLVFETYVADTTASPIVVATSFPAAVGGCAILYNAKPAMTNFTGLNGCGGSLLRNFMLTGELLIEGIEQISASELRVVLNSPDAEDITISLSDVLGHQIQSSTDHVETGKQKVSVDLGSLPSGTYVIEVQTKTGRAARKIVIIR